MDEAMHPLTTLCFGLYGQVLPNQNGAPLRTVIPWKYGFKCTKALVRVKFMTTQPETSWNTAAPNEYGFYSNVNPNVDHPRWSQKTERRLGGSIFSIARQPTLMFNGYGDQVASLYNGHGSPEKFLDASERASGSRSWTSIATSNGSSRPCFCSRLGPLALWPTRPITTRNFPMPCRCSAGTRKPSSATRPGSGRWSSSASPSASRRCAGCCTRTGWFASAA